MRVEQEQPARLSLDILSNMVPFLTIRQRNQLMLLCSDYAYVMQRWHDVRKLEVYDNTVELTSFAKAMVYACWDFAPSPLFFLPRMVCLRELHLVSPQLRVHSEHLKGLRNVESLFLYNLFFSDDCDFIDGDVLKTLLALPRLKNLQIKKLHFEPSERRRCGELRGWHLEEMNRGLERLSIKGVKVPPCLVESLCRRLPSLRELSLESVDGITDCHAFLHLVSHSTSIQTLDIPHDVCTAETVFFSQGGVLPCHLPPIHTVRIQGVNVRQQMHFFIRHLPPTTTTLIVDESKIFVSRTAWMEMLCALPSERRPLTVVIPRFLCDRPDHPVHKVVAEPTVFQHSSIEDALEEFKLAQNV